MGKVHKKNKNNIKIITYIILMESLLNIIEPLFATNQWKMSKKENTICYRNKQDEFTIALLPKTSEYEITVPLREVFYKNKFYNLTTAVDYMQMHLNYYSEK
jgi:hypothetical protein